MRLALPLAAANTSLLVCGLVAAAVILPGSPAPDAPAAPEAARPTQQAEVPTPPAAAVPTTPPPAVAAPAARPPAAPQPAKKAKPPVARTRPPAPVQRAVTRTRFAPYATAGPVTLHFPGDVVEVIGLHQSGHDGAQPQQPTKSSVRIGLLGQRGRDTSPQGASDIVMDPTREVRSPVTGTVLRAGTYTLYCDHVDQFLVVEPDAQPGWEVKLLHFEGLAVRAGDRVQAGVTVVGSNARVLPFRSQVDKHTVAPHWPHVHLEVVDPSVPDRPSGGSCD